MKKIILIFFRILVSGLISGVLTISIALFSNRLSKALPYGSRMREIVDFVLVMLWPGGYVIILFFGMFFVLYFLYPKLISR